MKHNSMSDDDLDTLLSQGRLSGAQREHILEGVLSETAPAPTRWRGWYALWAIPALVAVAAVLLVLRPADDPALRAKGGSVQPVALEAGCAGGCRVGSTLMFRVGHARTGGFLTAFARRENTPRLWFFPTANGTMPAIEVSDEPTVLRQGVRLAEPGPHTIEFLVLARSASRQDIIAHEQGRMKLTVVAQQTVSVEVAP